MLISFQDYRSLLSQYIHAHLGKMALLALLLFAGIGLQLLNPQVLRMFIDQAKAGQPVSHLVQVALLFLGVALLQQVFGVAATVWGVQVSWLITNQLRGDLALHCLQLDMQFHKQHTPGDMIERVDGDVSALANFFTQFVINLFGNAILLIGILILLLRENLSVGLSLLGCSMVTLMVLTRMRSIAVPHWESARQANSDLFGYVEERLSGAEDIRTNGAIDFTMRHLYKLMGSRLKSQRCGRFMENVIWTATTAMLMLGTVVALTVGGHLYMLHKITVGTVVLIYVYTEALRLPLEQITAQMQDLQKAGASIIRIQHLLRMRSALADGLRPLETSGPLSVEFKNVSFSYESELVLHDISFKLQPGRTLGILGRTGSGKTTISRLLSRLYDPISGTICVGGVDIREFRLRDLRRRIGVVTQDVHLFGATLRENLRLFDTSIPDEAIVKVIEDIGMSDWLRGLTSGLDTVLGEDAGLSAGEMQLMAFGRVLLEDVDIVILDEASSRLDPITERLTQQAVKKLLHGRTGIIIAHRLQTIEHADDIMILEDGKICELSSRSHLMNTEGSRFNSLMVAGKGFLT